MGGPLSGRETTEEHFLERKERRKVGDAFLGCQIQQQLHSEDLPRNTHGQQAGFKVNRDSGKWLVSFSVLFWGTLN